jgi:hypothetical protein
MKPDFASLSDNFQADNFQAPISPIPLQSNLGAISASAAGFLLVCGKPWFEVAPPFRDASGEIPRTLVEITRE